MSVAVNDAKRAMMGGLVRVAVHDKGWTVNQLAALFRVTPGAVRVWMRGESMGTNAIRAELAELRTPAEERPRLRELAASLRREADTTDENTRKAALVGALHVARYNDLRAANLRERAHFLESV